MGPAMVVLLASVSVIMKQHADAGHHPQCDGERHRRRQCRVFAIATIIINIPLAFLIPSSSGTRRPGHAALAPLADFAGVSRETTITAWIMGHGLTLLWSPTSVVVGWSGDRPSRLRQVPAPVWPLILALFVVVSIVIAVSASIA